MKETTIADIDVSDFSSFIFKANHVFIEENSPSEIYGADIDSITSFRGFT